MWIVIIVIILLVSIINHISVQYEREMRDAELKAIDDFGKQHCNMDEELKAYAVQRRRNENQMRVDNPILIQIIRNEGDELFDFLQIEPPDEWMRVILQCERHEMIADSGYISYDFRSGGVLTPDVCTEDYNRLYRIQENIMKDLDKKYRGLGAGGLKYMNFDKYNMSGGLDVKNAIPIAERDPDGSYGFYCLNVLNKAVVPDMRRSMRENRFS